MMIFKVVLFCTERKLKWRAAYQECPAEARWTLHLHGTDSHWQRRSLRPPGCQRWVVTLKHDITVFFWVESLFWYVKIYIGTYPWPLFIRRFLELIRQLHKHLRKLSRDNASAVSSPVTVGRKQNLSTEISLELSMLAFQLTLDVQYLSIIYVFSSRMWINEGLYCRFASFTTVLIQGSAFVRNRP